MATIFSHGIAAAALGTAFPPPKSARFWFYGIVCSMVPDSDVIGFRFGIHYGDMLGHRGLTHSIAFALLLSGIVSAATYSRDRHIPQRTLWFYLFLATVSHGILDAFTNGGLGVAFFLPFNNDRSFFPVNPIEVSPIGARFFSVDGIEVVNSEALWIWLPSLAFVVVSGMIPKLLGRKGPQ